MAFSLIVPPKISLSSSSFYSEFFDVGKASLSVGRRWVEIVVQQEDWNLKCIITVAVIWVADYWLMKYMQLLFFCCIQHFDKIQIVCCMNSTLTCTQSRENEKKDNNIFAHLSLLLSRFSSFLHSTHAVSQTVLSWLFGAVFSCQCANNAAGVLFLGLMIVALATPFKYDSFAMQGAFSGFSIMPMTTKLCS